MKKLLLIPFFFTSAWAEPDSKIQFQVYPPNTKISIIQGDSQPEPLDSSGVIPNKFLAAGRGDLEFLFEDPQGKHARVTVSVHKNLLKPGTVYPYPSAVSLKPIGLAIVTDWFQHPTGASWLLFIGVPTMGLVALAAYQNRKRLAAIQTEAEVKAEKIRVLETLVGVKLSPEKDFFDRVGNYYLLKSVGHGLMGEVFLGCHVDQLNVQGLVALKRILNTYKEMDPEAIPSFLRECKRQAQINHPHVVKILESGEDDQGGYLAMEYMDRGDFRKLLNQSAPLDFPAALKYFQQIASGLQAIHDAGIIHRDLKAENILVNSQGQLKISDFGTARKTQNDTVHMTQMSLDGNFTVRGTPEYTAPEVWQALTRQIPPESIVDPGLDQYAIGVLLYSSLTKEFPQKSFQDPGSLCEGRIRPITDHRQDLPQHVVETVHRLLAANPKDRFPKVKDALRAIGLELL